LRDENDDDEDDSFVVALLLLLLLLFVDVMSPDGKIEKKRFKSFSEIASLGMTLYDVG
jgi:hypothetical protein